MRSVGGSKLLAPALWLRFQILGRKMTMVLPSHAIVALVAGAFVVVFAEIFLSGLLWGAGYSPSPRRSIVRMLELAEVGENTRLYDLGSGFGRVVFEAAERCGATCVGVEIDPLKCWWSRRVARRRHLDGKVEIKRENLFTVDVSDADVVFLFLFPPVMRRISEKLLAQMKPGRFVVSQSHKIPGWQPVISDEKLDAYLYRVPPRTVGP